jgi:ABC transporter substrate binding protein/Resolvase, N terminal domain
LVALGEVGIVGSREVSRLSRTDKDWCRLLEVCQIFGTLIADEQQVYELNNLDDQLVLGIKGTLSVVELKVIRSGTATARAAKSATATIPIVFVAGGDPVEVGLVASLNRPGGNVTGVAILTTALTAKRLELLHELVPVATSIGFLVNPTNPTVFKAEMMEAETAARALGVGLVTLNASTVREIEAAFEILVAQRIGALLTSGDPLWTVQRAQLAALTVSPLDQLTSVARCWRC